MRITDVSQIGRLIQKERQKRGWSQQELAEKAYVGREWINTLENGKNNPRFDLVLRTLTVVQLGVEIRELATDPLEKILTP